MKENRFLVQDPINQKDFDSFVKKVLGFNSFSQFNVGFSHCEIGVFDINKNLQIIRIHGSGYTHELEHETVKNKDIRKKIFLVNSMSQMYSYSKQKKSIISKGDSVLLPSWEPVTEIFSSIRNSVTVCFYLDDILDEEKYKFINGMFFTNGISSWDYGVLINRLVQKLYMNQSDSMVNKILSSLQSLISLQIETLLEKEKSICHKSSMVNWKIADILEKIDENITDEDFNLIRLSDIMGVTSRCIQQRLSQDGLTFRDIVMQKKCEILRGKIEANSTYSTEYNMYASGFKSISSANRAFLKLYGLSPAKLKRTIK